MGWNVRSHVDSVQCLFTYFNHYSQRWILSRCGNSYSCLCARRYILPCKMVQKRTADLEEHNSVVYCRRYAFHDPPHVCKGGIFSCRACKALSPGQMSYWKAGGALIKLSLEEIYERKPCLNTRAVDRVVKLSTLIIFIVWSLRFDNWLLYLPVGSETVFRLKNMIWIFHFIKSSWNQACSVFETYALFRLVFTGKSSFYSSWHI